MKYARRDSIPGTAVLHPQFPVYCDVDGEIYSAKTGKRRKLWKTRLGYLQLALGRTSYLAHRIVADVFCPNPDKKPFINHRNGIKWDNRAENLEWCTQLENVRHARDSLGIDFGKLRGDCHPNRKMTHHMSLVLLNVWMDGYSIEELCRIFMVSQRAITSALEKVTNGKYRLGRICKVKRNKARPYRKHRPKRKEQEPASARSN